MQLTATELLQYTDEERERWERWFRENGEELLRMPIAGQDERTAGALILHIFGPELTYVQLIRGETRSNYRGRRCERVDELFGFGIETRKAMRELVENLGPEEWTRVVEFAIGGRTFRASVRKVVFHALIHEIRHWAQVARIMRDHGFEPPEDHDLLWSTALL
jgi:uncharacterized damage-inducible protein DinB